MKTIYPKGKRLQKNSTHVAIQEGKKYISMSSA